MRNFASVAVEQTEQQHSENVTRSGIGSEVTLSKSNTEELSVPSRVSNGKPYSIYTSSEKWFIVSVASLAALFSPLTATIYLPAIPVITTTFHKSVELVNLTVTVYMILQGISPMFCGSLADRRLILLACLLVLSAACIGLALVLTPDYWLLMLLRCIQATGSASTVALGAGIMGDIATHAERGTIHSWSTSVLFH